VSSIDKARFKEALRRTQWYEGEYSDDPDDMGGATYKGVSKRFLLGIGDDREPKDLTDEDREDIYYRYFWLAAGCNKIWSDLVAFKLFDMAVNLGPVKAVKILQVVINDNHFTSMTDLKVDGVVGPKTLEAFEAVEDSDYKIVSDMRELQEIEYYKIVSNNPIQEKFYNGWLRRAAW